MQKLLKDLGWLLSGGLGDTIRQRNELRAQLAEAREKLAQARLREKTLEENLRKARPVRPVPFIMLNTLPKSGSIFLRESLVRGLGIPAREISCGYFPMDLADLRKLSDAAAGNTVAQAHLDPNPTNLRLLKEHTSGVVLHLRDPRQALLSWVHHVKSYADAGRLHQTMVTPPPPPALMAMNLTSIIDWHLVHHFPNMLDWMERWLAHVESGAGPQVLVSHYQDFHADAHGSICRILDFYEIPRWAYHSPEIPRDRSTHFRKGELEEWREVFNSAQQKICAELMAGYPRVNRLYGLHSGGENGHAAKSAPGGLAAGENGTRNHAVTAPRR